MLPPREAILRGASLGGKARAKKLSPERRREIAMIASRLGGRPKGSRNKKTAAA